MSMRRTVLFLASMSLLAVPGGQVAGASARAKAEAAVKEGDTALILGDLAAARKKYTEALAADAGYAQATVKLAWAELQGGADAEVVKLLEALVGKKGTPAEAYTILGAALSHRREWRKAAEAYETYLGKAKDDTMVRLDLARVYRALAEEGDDSLKDKALAAYEQVMREAEDDAALYRLAEEESFGLRYGAAGKLFREGKDAFATGDLKVAVSKLEGVVKAHPEIEEAQYLLGMAYASPDVKRRADAIKAWGKAPKIKEAQLHLGIELHSDGDLTSAEARLSKAIDLDPDFPEAHYHLAALYAERGDESKAVAHWERVMEIDPNSETGKWARTKAELLTARTQGEFQEGQVIDPATEVALGQKFVDQVLAEWPEVNDPKLVARLETIFDKLTVATQRDDIRYHLYVVDAQMWGTPVVNAFAFPGGHVFISKALIEGIKLRYGDRDDYYAAVIGHELAHAALRHIPERWKFVQTVVNQPNVSPDELYSVLGLLGTGMTRQAEYEADRYGTLYMYRAGYNPKYMYDFWNTASKVLPDTPPGSDHATHEERAARTRDFLIELRGRVAEFDRATAKMKEEDYTAAARHLEVFLAVLPRSAPGHMNLAVAKHRAALARVGTEQKYKRTTDLDPDSRAAAVEVHAAEKEAKADPRINQRLMREAAAEYKTALRIDPGYALARANYGALLLDLAQTKAAKKVLEMAVKHAPKDAAAWNNLGIVYVESSNKKKAIAAFEKAAALDPKLADPWFNLAALHGDDGKATEAIAAYAEYVQRDGGSGWAKVARARKGELEKKAAVAAGGGAGKGKSDKPKVKKPK